MRDRESSKILSNGAIRYGIYDENGSLLRYEYIKLEDEPTVSGSIYNRFNVLPDSVCNALKIENTSEPKDAFMAIHSGVKEASKIDYRTFIFGR